VKEKNRNRALKTGFRTGDDNMRKRLQKLFAGVGMMFALFIGGGIVADAANYADLFDASYYAEKNPDVVAAFGTDANVLYSHYVNNGIHEGRNAGPLFDVKKYRENNSDLEGLYADNWAAYVNQYLTEGLKEGRIGYGEEFDAASYANRYSDLRNVYGYDVKRLYTHYITCGKKEGRNASWETTDAEKKEENKKPVLNGHLVSRKANQLFKITNEERRLWGVRNLTWDNSLAALAETRAMELPIRYDHVRPNGDSIYEYHVDEENISMWYDDAEDVHYAFMKDWRDANIIIDPDLRKVGIACYEVGGVYYWCELFRE
jgi:hypothetical protein